MLDDNIYLDDTNDEIEEDILKFNNIEILSRNDIYSENQDDLEIEKINELHKKNQINNSELFDKIELCVAKNILNYSIVEQIVICAKKASLETEVMNNLTKLYDFLIEADFQEDDYKIIREIIKKNLVNVNHENNNFKEITKVIKEKIIIYKLKIEDDYIKNIINSCVEKDWSLKNIKEFLSYLKLLYIKSIKGLEQEELEKIKIENEKKIHITESLLNIIKTFPNVNFIEKLKKIKFDNLSNIARDFYIECSSGKMNTKAELNIQELLDALQKMNKNYFSKDKINMFKEQIEICQEIVMKKKIDIKTWKKNELQKLLGEKGKEKYKNIAKILSAISLALNKANKFYLREAQVLALLIFIDNYEMQDKIDMKDQKGIIEEIPTGEGKSSIISCLAAYFALNNHKVDIITSSNLLAERDANKFKKFFDLLKIKVGFCKANNKDSDNDTRSQPYRADIVYGTFLSFEGDLLEEISSKGKIRGKRDYDIIIIDEVDNAFIDCIEGSTQLSKSSKGYQFLFPLYISIYFFVDILDNFYLNEVKKEYEEIILIADYKQLDEISKKKIMDKLSDDSDRKDIFIDYIEKYFKKILNEVNNEKENEYEIKNQLIQELDEDDKLKNFFRFPHFLKDFVETNLFFWINNAFSAKNEMKLEKNYTLSSKGYGYKNITPIDKKNTGELEFNTVYKRGLHQMLQIKENVRIHPENLDHTYMSHITYFSKYKNKKKFFGLTGTIGGEETFGIYKSKYFNSNLIYMPSYISKKFIELPAIICEDDYNKHLFSICNEIIFHFSKGRKILVICTDIKEGYKLETMLKEVDKNLDIFLYLKNDEDDLQEKLNQSKKRIIISTNLGGRGTDIETSEQEERNGGLHVIITKLSENSRTQKQAFGRTSRQGKKGSGQYIFTEKEGLRTYNELIKDRDEKEKNSINNINLDYLILKDNLFQDYVNYINQFENLSDEDGKYIKSDIDEKWSLFLSKNVDKEKTEKDIKDSFNIFMNQINANMELPNYEIFKNDFLRIEDGINKYENFQPESEKYFNFKNDSQCFYFASSYYKAIISHNKYKSKFNEDIKNNIFCKEILKNLEKTKFKLIKLIEINIDPILKSFVDWEKISKMDELIQISDNYKNSSDEGFKIQFKNRKKIVKNLIEIVEQNINIVKEYIKKYLPKNKKGHEAILEVESIEIKKSLDLGEKYDIDINEYLIDSGLKFSFEFKIKKKIYRRGFKYWMIFLGFFILFSIFAVFVPLISKGAFEYIFNSINEFLSKYEKAEYVDVHENNSLFSVIKSKIFSKKDKNKKEKNEIIQNNYNNVKEENFENEKDKMTKEELDTFEKATLEEIKNYIKEAFEENKAKIIEETKFLLLIDLFYKQTNWKRYIKNIISNYFSGNEKLEEKTILIKMCNKKSEHKRALDNLKEIIKESIINIVNKIKEKFESNEYNKEEIKRLEHIIINNCNGDVNEKSANDIVNQILSQNIIDKDGMFNIDLFKRKKEKEDKKKSKNQNKIINEEIKSQNVKIYYNTPYPENINKIKSIKHFSLPLNYNISIKNDGFLQDIQLLYAIKNYNNPDVLIMKDFSTKIINLLKRLYHYSTLDMKKEVEHFFDEIIQKIYDIIEAYLKEEIYPNILIKKNLRKNIELNKEEQKIYDLITQNSGKKALDLLNSKELFKVKK